MRCLGFLLYLFAPWPEMMCLYFSSFRLSVVTLVAVICLGFVPWSKELELLCIRSMHPLYEKQIFNANLVENKWIPQLSFFSPPNSLEIMSREGCVYPSTVWKCHPLRHDCRFGNTVNTNYLVNPGTHCNNCSFPSYKHIARRFGTIKQ